MDPEPSQKRSYSSSFTKAGESEVRTKRAKSECVRSAFLTGKALQDSGVSVESLVAKTVEIVNKSIAEEEHKDDREGRKSLEEPIQDVWFIDRGIEEKRKIRGKKTKIKWRRGDKWIDLRVVFSDSYIRLNESGYFVELDSTNIDLNTKEQSQIQKFIDDVLEEFSRSHDTHFLSVIQKENISWLKNLLLQCHEHFSKTISTLKKEVGQFEVNRRKINPYYILYPSPVSITWNPRGTFCVTENRINPVSKPIIGSICSYKNFIENPLRDRYNRNADILDDMLMVDERKEEEQNGEGEIFRWPIDEEINFSVFSSQNADDETDYEFFQNCFHVSSQEQKESKKQVSNEIVLVPNISVYSPKLKNTFIKFINAHSSSQAEPHRTNKLKVYKVINLEKYLEAGITYLVEKVKGSNDICEALLENEFQGYTNILDARHDGVTVAVPMKKYELVRAFAREKMRRNPHSDKLLMMKYLMVENEFFSLIFTEYLKEHFQKFNIAKKEEIQLGSYNSFDEKKAEEYVMDILAASLKFDQTERQNMDERKAKYMRNPSKYDDPVYRQKKKEKELREIEELKMLLKGYSKESMTIEEEEDSASPYFSNMMHSTTSYKSPQLVTSKSMNNESIEMRKVEVSKMGKRGRTFKTSKLRNVNYNEYGHLVVRKKEMLPFHFPFIVEKRKELLNTMIPILWLKDRNIEQFEFKIIKRVLITSSKISNFLDKLGKIQRKIEAHKLPFLNNMVEKYRKMKKQQDLDGQQGSSFIVTCQKCEVEFVVYYADDLPRNGLCSRCHYIRTQSNSKNA